MKVGKKGKKIWKVTTISTEQVHHVKKTIPIAAKYLNHEGVILYCCKFLNC